MIYCISNCTICDDLEWPSSHSSIASLFKCDFSYNCAADEKASSDTEHHVVPRTTCRCAALDNCRCRTISGRWRCYAGGGGGGTQWPPSTQFSRNTAASQHDGNKAKYIQLECGPMPDVMAALPNIGGPFYKSSVIPFLVPRCKVWLTSVERRRCSNEAKSRNPLKFAGVPKSRQQISAGNGPKFSIL